MPLLTKWLTQVRLSQVAKHLGGTVLDVGCGHGYLLEFLPAQVEQIVLVDNSAEREEQVAKRLARSSVHGLFYRIDLEMEEPPAEWQQFETVVLAAILEHLKEPSTLLRRIALLLAEGGQLVLTTPTPWGGRWHWLGSRVWLTHPEAAQEHHRLYDRQALEKLLSENGFRLIKYRRFLCGLNQLVVAEKECGSRTPSGG